MSNVVGSIVQTMRIKPLEFLKSVFNQGIFSKPKRSLVYAALAAILAGVIVMFSVPAVARGFSVLFATQGFISEDVKTEIFPMMIQYECSGPEICSMSNPPLECKNASGNPIPCYKPSGGTYCLPCGG